MSGKRLVTWLTAALLVLMTIQPAPSFAKSERTIADESIYDLLVDRFNNGAGSNDIDVDAKNPHVFNGGDFTGISARLQHILDMNFTMISFGPVFLTATYDGRQVLDYEKIEPHFGTDKELTSLIKEMHKKNLKVMVDLPLGGVSANHVWADQYRTIPAGDDTIDWDPADQELQRALIDTAIQFVEKFKVDGLRLTKIDRFEPAYLNEMIAALKEAQPDLYVITNEASTANFDMVPNEEHNEAIRESFVQVDSDSSKLSIFNENTSVDLLQYDDLTGPRYTYDIVELRQFPPTRWKLAVAALFTLPGVPLVPYATEIAVNGKEAPDTHPFFNFKTDMELKDMIGDLNTLRNKSETLRKGDFKMLHNEDGFVVYKRSSEDETWIIAINNSSVTRDIAIPVSEIGEKKKLRGVLDQDLVRESKDGMFRVVLDRELAEIYIAEDDTGFNTPYLIASILVYVFFIAFLVAVLRKGKQRRQDGAAK